MPAASDNRSRLGPRRACAGRVTALRPGGDIVLGQDGVVETRAGRLLPVDEMVLQRGRQGLPGARKGDWVLAFGTLRARADALRNRMARPGDLRKGNPTIISDGGKPILVNTGGPELASIGTGDVLAGMIGALWARGLDSLAATVSGAYWHGIAAADLAVHRTVTADRLADHIAAFAW